MSAKAISHLMQASTALCLSLALEAGANAEEIKGQADPAKWTLAWSDEFDKPGLPDPAKWDYEVGFVRNGEAQYYTKARIENAHIENGLLTIEGRKELYSDLKSGKTADYTAASIVSKGRNDVSFGRVEVRAKLPSGLGVWPAIWTLGTNIDAIGWPACGEIDILEYVGCEPDRIHGGIHFRKGGEHKSANDKGPFTAKDPTADFHVFAIDWSPEKLDFLHDGQILRTIKLEVADDGGGNAFRLPHYLLLNLALGGSWGGRIDDSKFPQRFIIDYVRVYTAKP